MNYYVFHGRVTPFYANNSLTQCRITMKFLHIFLDPEVFFSSHTMFINASTKEFTLTHLVTFRISRSRSNEVLLRLWVNSLMDEMFMNELIVKYKVATCHFIYCIQ